MRPSDKRAFGPPDWIGWFALAWAVGFGFLYIQMILDKRLATMLALAGQILGGWRSGF